MLALASAPSAQGAFQGSLKGTLSLSRSQVPFSLFSGMKAFLIMHNASTWASTHVGAVLVCIDCLDHQQNYPWTSHQHKKWHVCIHQTAVLLFGFCNAHKELAHLRLVSSEFVPASIVHIHSFTHSLTHSFIHLFIHSFIHSFIL